WRSAPFVLVALALDLVWPFRAASAAPPQVEIRAQTKLVLDRMRLTGDDTAEIRGQLVDGLTGDGIPDQSVTIQVAGETEHATTGADGRFAVTVAVTPGQQAVELSYRGTSLMTPSRLSQVTDPAQAQVSLAIDAEDAPGGA